MALISPPRARSPCDNNPPSAARRKCFTQELILISYEGWQLLRVCFVVSKFGRHSDDLSARVFRLFDHSLPRQALTGKTEMPQLSSVACSILDARSPEQFIFVPDWMMKALRLEPRSEKIHPHVHNHVSRVAQRKIQCSNMFGL